MAPTYAARSFVGWAEERSPTSLNWMLGFASSAQPTCYAGLLDLLSCKKFKNRWHVFGILIYGHSVLLGIKEPIFN